MTKDELRDELLARAFLFDDPLTYAAGVEDALAAAVSNLDVGEAGRAQPT
ncbi:MAG: hypothetical protein M3N57_01615 [Actinomycetota bacterium]|nr:hypothetical protein [Actinomycetota bacterium]